MLTNLAAAVVGMAISQADFAVSATVHESLEVGESFAVELVMTPGDGWSPDDAGIPGYIVQLGVPRSVTPKGRVLTEYRELSRNEFLQEPYERLVKRDREEIEFTLDSEPGLADLISINVLAYLSHEDGRTEFARRRIELPVRAGATGEATTQATTSDWGLDTAGLQIGDAAPDVTLPNKDGEMVSLADRFKASDVIITTYRAFW